MVPPILYTTRIHLNHDIGSVLPDPPSGGWSSIIGIVVAIIGNVLISIALNVQRYAHIRLSREREQRDEEHKHSQPEDGRTQGYGAESQTNGNGTSRSSLAVGDKTVTMRRSSQAQDESTPLLRQHTAHDDNDAEHEESSSSDKDKTYLSSPWWWLGITLMIVGESGNFLAYGFAPASVVSPLGVVALISNCLIAPWMLHESFRKRDALGVLIAVGGCVVVVLSASGDNPKLDAGKIWELISTWEFETYLGITLGLIVALMFASNKYGDKSILIDLGLVGLFGGYTALSTKGIASLLSNTIWRVVTFPVTYLLLAVLISTAVMQIKYVNRALQRFDSTQVIPTQFVMFTLSVIIGSAVLYQDFKRRSTEDAFKFFAGCALTFLGVYCITSGRSQDHDRDDEDSSDSESGDVRVLAEDESAIRSAIDDPATPGGQSRVQPQEAAEALLRISERAPNINAAIHPTLTKVPKLAPNSQQPPPLHATTSEPVLPTSALSEPSPVMSRHQSTLPLRQGSHGRPKTPENPTSSPDPGSVTPARFGSIGRHSLADMLPHPGPFTNPLSNSLTAIVADSLRRGVEIGGSARRRSIRRRRSRNMDEHSGFGRSLGETTLDSSIHGSRLAPPFPPVINRSASHDTGRLESTRGIVRKPSDLAGRQPSVTEEAESEEHA